MSDKNIFLVLVVAILAMAAMTVGYNVWSSNQHMTAYYKCLDLVERTIPESRSYAISSCRY